jgi:hypothetical protein
MTSAYEDLKKDFDELRSSHEVVVQEKPIWGRRSTRKRNGSETRCSRS